MRFHEMFTIIIITMEGMRKIFIKKNFFSYVIFLVLASVFLSACDADTGGAGDDTIVIKFAAVDPADTTVGRGITAFKDYVEEESDGQIEVELYLNAQLGGEREATEALGIGNVHMTSVDAGIIGAYEPSFKILGMPFLFDSKDAGYEAIDSELGDRLEEDAENSGFKLLGFYNVGSKHITNDRREIHEPKDLKGLTMRLAESDIYIKTFEELGANTTSMGFDELYSALEQGAVDGQENSLGLSYSSKLMEEQDYLTLTSHGEQELAIVTDLDFYENLSEDIQEIINKGIRYSIEEVRENLVIEEEEVIENMKEEGVTVTELTEENREKFIKATEPVYDYFAEEYDEDLIDIAKQYNKD